MPVIRLVLVDDQAGVRRGLCLRLELEPDLVVVGEAGNGAEALTLVQAKHPDVVVMDIGMPVMDGFAATEALQWVVPRCAVVMLSMSEDKLTHTYARATGAAFVSKHEPVEMLIDAIRGSTLLNAPMV